MWFKEILYYINYKKMKSMFNKTKIVQSEKVKIYCEVKFARKDEAKEKGARWDMDKKLWFFQYDLKEFLTTKICILLISNHCFQQSLILIQKTKIEKFVE